MVVAPIVFGWTFCLVVFLMYRWDLVLADLFLLGILRPRGDFLSESSCILINNRELLI